MQLLRGLCLGLFIASSLCGWVDMYKFPWTHSPLQFMFAVQCPNTSMCLILGGESNTETGVYYTTDDFNSTTRAQMDSTGLLLLDMRMGSATHGIAVGAGALKLPGIVYTRNSLEWKSSDDLWLLTGQCAQKISDTVFTFVGEVNDILGKDGVAISHTGGSTWENKPFPAAIVNKLPGTVNCSARYGAFPSATTWYITAGSWPGNNSDPQIHYLNSRVGAYRTPQTKSRVFRRTLAPVPSAGPNNGYTGAILKTTDGGANYEIQYTTENSFYFNDIGCIDENTCVAVGEGFSQDGSTDPGARIMRTADGGKTWTQVNKGADGTSAMRLKIVSPTEIWTAYSNAQSQLKMASQFMVSKDGGKTFTASGDAIKGVGDVFSIDFVNPTLGYATGITETEIFTPMKYTA